MRCSQIVVLIAPILCAACAGNPDRYTLADLHEVEPDVTEVRIEDGLDRAIVGYRQFLEQTPESTLTPEAMRRLADLKLEKDFGIHGDTEIVESASEDGIQPPAKRSIEPAVQASIEPVVAPPAKSAIASTTASHRAQATGIADHSESDADFERRAARERGLIEDDAAPALRDPSGEPVESAGPLEAIELYDRILATYPAYPHNDQVLYQKARAFDELGRVDEAIAVIADLIRAYPDSEYIDEVQFRRAEYFFTRKRYLEAEAAYQAVTEIGADSEFYELALYKLGWTFYKQDVHERALDNFIALLDYKVDTGYDFDQTEDEAEERRIADTFRVISLSFSYEGGPQAIQDYFAASGTRSYEDRVYSHLGEFYLDKLRYNDAAATYEAFVARYPLHRASPHFGMRVVEIYEAGSFPILVLQSKKVFAERYGLNAEYWRHFDIEESPDVLSYLKSNLKDLANHYHALYQDPEQADDRDDHFAEALHWYHAYLESFPDGEQTPAIHYQMADLLLEHEDFAAAAEEYEHIAYDYPAHEQAAAAGYAAIFAHRENQRVAPEERQAAVRREAVTSSLRFVDNFPSHEQAATVLDAAVTDLYDMKEYVQAIARGQSLIDGYPDADASIRRTAWNVVAHASFDIEQYAPAEQAYTRVLEMTPEDDESHQALVDNLAAAIYKQGEQANLADDQQLAADHFLRIRQAAPTSEIRPAAEYDAAAALIQLEDWAGAADVLESFRQAYPDHELNHEATKQIALVYRKMGDLARAAAEYERIADESDDSELRSEALLYAGELYEQAGVPKQALTVYRRYIEAFPKPLETAVETRFKIAKLHDSAHDDDAYHEQLRQIVAIDAAAGGERTDRVRYLAAQSALVLAEPLYQRFDEVALIQPFEKNLQEKQRRMDAAIAAFSGLVDYEVGEVVAAATYYMAEIYFDFSKALLESERPAGLDSAQQQDYEMALEEEAFPFEEQAIEVHEKNLDLMSAGVFNAWIEKSLVRLGTLMPGRYAKFEQSSGFIASMDGYEYRSPRAAKAGADEQEPSDPANPAG